MNPVTLRRPEVSAIAALGLGFGLSAVMCQHDSDTSSKISKSDVWEKWNAVAPEECEAFCEVVTACHELISCRGRCAWLLDGSDRISGELNSDCGERTRATLGCAAPILCDDQDLWVDCSTPLVAESKACGGQPVYFPGWESCHRMCDLDASCASQYLDWPDCYGQCKGNFLADAAAGCMQEATALRECIASIKTCKEYKAFRDNDENHYCKQEGDAWQQCVSPHG